MILPQIAGVEKNKSETTLLARDRMSSRMKRRGRCVFVLEGGEGTFFCDAPAFADSAYCGLHHRICAVQPGSEAGRDVIRNIEREAARTAPVPIELAYLSCVAAPELDSADDPHDIAACLDFMPPHDRIDE